MLALAAHDPFAADSQLGQGSRRFPAFGFDLSRATTSLLRFSTLFIEVSALVLPGP